MEIYKILVVDDEPDLCEGLKLNLEIEGYEADTAYSAEEALEMDLSVYDLILLDVMMGKMSGFEMARVLKRNPKTSSIPIIFCTAKNADDDMIAGLNLGADDYVTKPYNIRNILARIKSVLRRSERGNTSSSSAAPGEPAAAKEAAKPQRRIIREEGLVIDLDQIVCTIDEVPVRMPRKEFELLSLFMSNPGKIFSREDILQKVWSDEVVVVNRVVDVNVTRLRSKIGKYGKLIVTRSGYGYGFKV
ncbi:MAG: response regulator transcription factor [Muribaculaceae bacterium]|nr:response regulator transcription factor [Muribaculaceae bacterium]